MLSSRLVTSFLSSAGRGQGTGSLRPILASRGFHGSAARRVIHQIKSVNGFEKAVADHELAVVDCFATWCGPCKAIGPLFEKHSEDTAFKDKIHFVKFDVDKLPVVAGILGVRSLPTFFFFKNGKKVDELVGANPDALLDSLRKIAS
ncbi:hypothetical protein E4U21_001415 [Claviceps maximensis]|nr:hypothetical protein E4U21_001415 [Claviceps maximensis]